MRNKRNKRNNGIKVLNSFALPVTLAVTLVTLAALAVEYAREIRFSDHIGAIQGWFAANGAAEIFWRSAPAAELGAWRAA